MIARFMSFYKPGVTFVLPSGKNFARNALEHLAQELEHGMGDPLGHSERRCRAGRRVLADEGGSAQQGFTGVRRARRSCAGM